MKDKVQNVYRVNHFFFTIKCNETVACHFFLSIDHNRWIDFSIKQLIVENTKKIYKKIAEQTKFFMCKKSKHNDKFVRISDLIYLYPIGTPAQKFNL